MKSKNRAEQYFNQKDLSVLEIILLILAVASAIISIFIDGGGPIGLPILLICIVVFCICRSLKIKDTEIDQMLEKIMQDNQIAYSDSTIVGYDLKNTVVKKRKDGKLISPKHYITDIVTAPDGNKALNVYIIDLVSFSVEMISQSVTDNNEITLMEETIKTGVGSVKMYYLNINGDCMIPVSLNDYKSSQIVENICNRHEKH